MTRVRDNAARIGLLIVSIGLAVMAFAVGAAIAAWNGFVRTVILGAIAAAAAAAFWGGVEIRTPYAQRTPLRLRRHGEPSQTAALSLPVGPGPVPPVRISLDPKNSLISGVIFLVMAIVGWTLASRTDFSTEDTAIVTIVALATTPWLTYFAFRSGLRMLFARRAIEIASEALTLGSALGYWPPLKLPRESIVAISLPETRQGEISIVLADRTYRVNSKHMVDPATVADRFRTAWPERAGSIEPDPLDLVDLEITHQQPTQPPGAIVELANRMIARRRMRSGAVLPAFGQTPPVTEYQGSDLARPHGLSPGGHPRVCLLPAAAGLQDLARHRPLGSPHGSLRETARPLDHSGESRVRINRSGAVD